MDKPPIKSVRFRAWFSSALQIKGSVIGDVLPSTLLATSFGFLIALLFQLGYPVALPSLVTFVPNIVLGLLLVFRTNTAYERFWEGRKWWGSLNNDIRNLARLIWVATSERTPEDHEQKVRVLYLLAAFAVAMKLYLRQESIVENPELKSLILPNQYHKLQAMNHPPLQIAFWIGDYLQSQYQNGYINIYQLTAMHQLLNGMVDALGGSERILRTPMPLAYAIHLKQLLLLYCFSLPFQMVESLGWLTGLVVGLISFTLLGIEAIGVEIENPFGRDPNDLPLDAICHMIRRNIEDLMSLTPQTNQGMNPPLLPPQP
ncbi:MAG: bestrophin family ion channel [Cyanobacteriota bacterium]|nr:bestrophin family ion channel [Cyanobacteriota bacterium]